MNFNNAVWSRSEKVDIGTLYNKKYKLYITRETTSDLHFGVYSSLRYATFKTNLRIDYRYQTKKEVLEIIDQLNQDEHIL